MMECFVILEFPRTICNEQGEPTYRRRVRFPLPGNEDTVTACIRAGAEFVGVAVGAEEVREMMEASSDSD